MTARDVADISPCVRDGVTVDERLDDGPTTA
jgi:hypothetical protein